MANESINHNWKAKWRKIIAQNQRKRMQERKISCIDHLGAVSLLPEVTWTEANSRLVSEEGWSTFVSLLSDTHTRQMTWSSNPNVSPRKNIQQVWAFCVLHVQNVSLQYNMVNYSFYSNWCWTPQISWYLTNCKIQIYVTWCCSATFNILKLNFIAN